jgi:hypothetical protein
VHVARGSKSGVSSAQIATAFNLLMQELHGPLATSLDEARVEAARTFWTADFPNLFSTFSLRPVAASILLYLIVYNGGVSDVIMQAESKERRPLDFSKAKLHPARLTQTDKDQQHLAFRYLVALPLPRRVQLLQELVTIFGY